VKEWINIHIQNANVTWDEPIKKAWDQQNK
jgi:hypothetical protein